MAKPFLPLPAVDFDDSPVADQHAGGTPEGLAPGYVLPPGAGPKTWFFESLYTMKARDRDTDGVFSLMEIYAPKGWGAPPHLHSRVIDVFWILEGEADFAIGDTVYPNQKAGSFIYIPHSTRHEFQIRSEFARLLLLVLPGGFEPYFEYLGSSATNSGLPTPEQQRKITPQEYLTAKAVWGAMPTNDASLLPPLDQEQHYAARILPQAQQGPRL